MGGGANAAARAPCSQCRARPQLRRTPRTDKGGAEGGFDGQAPPGHVGAVAEARAEVARHGDRVLRRAAGRARAGQSVERHARASQLRGRQALQRPRRRRQPVGPAPARGDVWVGLQEASEERPQLKHKASQDLRVAERRRTACAAESEHVSKRSGGAAKRGGGTAPKRARDCPLPGQAAAACPRAGGHSSNPCCAPALARLTQQQVWRGHHQKLPKRRID